MYPEDRVLVVYVPNPQDFAVIRDEGWYRVPQRQAPKGLYAEYFAFYFGRQFGPKKWAIHYYAHNLGHELLFRKDLLPDQPDHPRAEELYYKVQLSPLITCKRPILSMRWRRVTFIHTTWDRFQDATEINDLYIQGGPYVDRLFATLKERGVQAERGYQLKENPQGYDPFLVVSCQNGHIEITNERIPANDLEVELLLEEILQETRNKGGVTNTP